MVAIRLLAVELLGCFSTLGAPSAHKRRNDHDDQADTYTDGNHLEIVFAHSGRRLGWHTIVVQGVHAAQIFLPGSGSLGEVGAQSAVHGRGQARVVPFDVGVAGTTSGGRYGAHVGSVGTTAASDLDIITGAGVGVSVLRGRRKCASHSSASTLAKDTSFLTVDIAAAGQVEGTGRTVDVTVVLDVAKGTFGDVLAISTGTVGGVRSTKLLV